MENNKALNGCFYFKRTTNGNLLGEYSNNYNDDIFTECAVLEPGEDSSVEGYEGTYRSTWLQEKGSFSAELEITCKNENNKKFFDLKWSGNGVNYKGKGMLCDNILIGHYQNNKGE